VAIAHLGLRVRTNVDYRARLEPSAHGALAIRGAHGLGGTLLLGAFHSAAALAPGDIHPLAGGFPNCVSREEPSGNTVNGFAVQRFASIGLTKALTLQGFSSAGCPVDGAIGGSLTYTAALQPSLWFVAGAGVYGVPGHAPYPPRLSNDLRVDLMKQLNDQHAVTVGVGRRGITIGGTW